MYGAARRGTQRGTVKGFGAPAIRAISATMSLKLAGRSSTISQVTPEVPRSSAPQPR